MRQSRKTSQSPHMPTSIHPTLTQETLAGLGHQLGASNFEQCRTPEERREGKKKSMFLTGGVLEQWEHQGLPF